MFIKKSHNTFNYLFILFLSLTLCFSQETNKVDEATLVTKIDYFETLFDEEIIENYNYYSVTFRNALNATSNKTLIKRLIINISILERIKGNHIESINSLNDLIEDEDLNISSNDSLKVYLELRKSYIKLLLYPEVFDTNAKLDKLIKNGVAIPLWDADFQSALYNKLKQYDKAASALKKEINYLQRVADRKDSLIIPSWYNNLGFYYFKANELDSAYKYFQRSLKVSERSLKNIDNNAYDRLTALVKGNIAEIYIRQENFSDAIPLLEKDIVMGMTHDYNNEVGLGSTLKNINLLAKCYLNLNDLVAVSKTLKRGEILLTKLNDNSNTVDYYIVKSEYLHKVKKTDSSYHYLNKALRLKDSIDKLDVDKILAGNEISYNFSEAHKRIQEQQTKLKNKELALKDKMNFLYLFVSILFFILLMFSLYNGYKIRKSRKEVEQKNAEITEKNEMIRNALSEKEVLLKEVHHRVKNNLQIISSLLELQKIDIKDPKIRLALKEGQNRIQSVALIHKMMYQSENVSKVNMQAYLEDLLKILHQSYKTANKSVITSVEANNINFNITHAVPISLIVNEAVCNAYKHAFEHQDEGKIEVHLSHKSKNEYLLIIKDNGKGIHSKNDIEESNSIGLDLIKGLAKQLKGKVAITSKEGIAIHVQFNIKNE